MNLTQFSIRNPLVVATVTVALLLFGLVAYLSMGVGIVPQVNFSSVLITTTDAGSDPATIETQVTKPIEDAVAGLANVDTITSSSNEGVSTVVVQFTTAANPNLISVDTERVVNGIRSTLPATADSPSIIKFDTSAFPVLTIAASGPQSLDQINQVMKGQVQRAFEAVPGVQSVSLTGGVDREIQVKVDPQKLEAYGFGLNTVQLALQADQVETPAGLLVSGNQDLNVRLNSLVTTPDQLGQIILIDSPSGGVRLKDVATIESGFKTVTEVDRVNGGAAVTLVVTKKADANTLAVSAGIQKAMAQLQPFLPAGMRLDVVKDAAIYTQSSFDTIQQTLIQAVLLTGLILLLFLHTWRSTLVVLVSIPTSLFTTFGLMSILGMDLNLFSMLAITLSVGILVDDSIVVLENIYRHLGLGEPPVLAAINGRSEIGLAALTITLVDVAVYLPIALISGIAGDFIRPFALVIAAATLTSLAVSFTLTPLLASRLLVPNDATWPDTGLLARFGRRWNRGFDWLGRVYQRLLRGMLTRQLIRVGRLHLGARWAVIALGTLAFAAGIGLFASGLIGIDIFPSGDQSEVDVMLTMPSATTIRATTAQVDLMEQKLKSVPEVREVYTTIGGGGGFTVASGNTATLTVLLVPTNQRTRSAAQVMENLRVLLDPGLPNARLDLGLANAFGFGGAATQPIQIAVQGTDPTTLNRLVDQVMTAVSAIPGAVDVNNPNQKTQPEFVVNLSRATASNLGITSQAAATALRTSVSGVVVGKFRQAGQDDLDIRLMTNDSFRASPDNLASLPLLSATGTIVHLAQAGTITSGFAPVSIAHVARERSITVSASASGIAVGSLQNQIQARLDQIALPPGYSITYQGQSAQGAGAFSSIFQALGISVVLMYVLMLLLFRSLTLPLAVLMALPLAIVGALGALALTGNNFTLFSLLGIAMLVGLVGKNAILLVDYTEILRGRGLSRTAALLEAGPTRLRPIVMTTMSILVSLAPVALGSQSGSELLKSAALVLIGGLLTSTVLTLVFVPAMYTIFDDIQNFVLRMVRRLSNPRVMEPEELAVLRGGRPAAIQNPASRSLEPVGH